MSLHHRTPCKCARREACYSPAFDRPLRRREERGFTLAGLIVLLTVLGITLAYSVIPLWSTATRRDRDLQTIFAMKQYARAIREFQRRRNVFPVSLDQLKEQNNPRVLRALYPNPLSGEMDWILVPAGATGPAPPTTPQQGSTLPTTSGQPAAPVVPQGAAGAVGAFIGVRPPNHGKSVVKFRDSDSYEQWFFTVNELGTKSSLPPGIGAPGY